MFQIAYTEVPKHIYAYIYMYIFGYMKLFLVLFLSCYFCAFTLSSGLFVSFGFSAFLQGLGFRVQGCRVQGNSNCNSNSNRKSDTNLRMVHVEA